MAVQPIDLQTLFVRLQQVGQDQAALKDSVTQAQAVAGQEIVQKSVQQQSSVTQTPELQEGLEKVSDEEGRKEPREQSQKQKEEEEEKRRKANVFHDPDLGQHIDISG